MDLNGLDHETRQLIIQMQLEELEAIGHERQGKQGIGAIADFEYAAAAYRNELNSYQSFDADETLCLSIARAVREDAATIAHVVSGNDERGYAVDDLYDDDNPTDAPQRAQEDAAVERFAALNVHVPAPPAANRPRPAAAAAAATAAPGVVLRQTTITLHRECASCTERFPQRSLTECPCSHWYCRNCIGQLFQTCLTDESLFPPRCCRQPIPIETARPLLTARIVGEFEAKKLELETPNRVYCHKPACSTFVPPSWIHNNVATCVRCFGETCAGCRAAVHRGDCPPDGATLNVLRMAGIQGWQRCFSCRNMVELNTGCNHITCRCGGEFCYVCGQVWKTCPCAQWDEERLVDRANAVLERDAGNHNGLDGPGLVRLRQQMMDNLQANHECVNHRWRSRQGVHDCEECGETMRVFIYECRDCHVMACRLCKLNRL